MRPLLVILLLGAVVLGGVVQRASLLTSLDKGPDCTLHAASPLPLEPADHSKLRASLAMSLCVGLKALLADGPMELTASVQTVPLASARALSPGPTSGRTLQAQAVRWQI